MKLNYKRTIFVGFAFFLICAFWGAYEVIVPLMLVNKFGMSQTASGFIMALDNILAVFLLPLFGTLSDKTNTKMGKRTPYILVGTIVAIVAFMGLSFVDAAQLDKLYSNYTKPEEFQQMLWEQDDLVLTNSEYSEIFNKESPKKYTLQDYACQVLFNKNSNEVSESELTQAKGWFISLTSEEVGAKATLKEFNSLSAEEQALYQKNYYYYDYQTKTYTANTFVEGAARINAYSSLVSGARSTYAHKQTTQNPTILILFIIVLCIVLVSMSIFRSPAVSLMPDVTIKPLRSSANAVINLMGTFGAMIVLVFGILFGTGKIGNQVADYRLYIAAVCAVMAIALVLFMILVKEKKWAQEMQEESQRLGLETESDELAEEYNLTKEELEQKSEVPMRKANKGKFISLILLLVSVALWYAGYNAISSKYSLYAQNVLHKDFNLTLLIAQATAVIAYIPAGYLAERIGRKKSIMGGVVLLSVVFFIGAGFTSDTPSILINILFALAGIAWATINVNSFPMVVEMSKGSDIGKYTGYYYVASMASQAITPLLSGLLMDLMGNMRILFYYGGFFVGLAFLTMWFVRHGDNLTIKNIKDREKHEKVGEAKEA